MMDSLRHVKHDKTFFFIYSQGGRFHMSDKIEMILKFGFVGIVILTYLSISR